MKKTWKYLLMVAVVLSLGMSITSCKDDDKDEKTSEQEAQETQEKADRFWDVVSQLVAASDITSDYKGKTFEPTIGEPLEDNATVRIVATNDQQTAAQRFADLVGASDIDENTPSYTFSDPDIGTLTYTRGGNPSEWATVDVNIRQVPKLQKIIYRVGDAGDNGSFSGSAYYRFGDVVSRLNASGKTEYWVCVRPAFGKEGKEDSHWVCVNTLDEKNIFNYNYGDQTWYIPQNLGTNKEQMQNFAEMLWAIINPVGWWEDAVKYHKDGVLWGFSGLPVFTDFTKKKLDYHNQYFWQNVQQAWKNGKVTDTVFGMPFDQLTSAINADGLNLLYKGYSWWTKTSWDCTLNLASYTNGTKDSEKNLHKAVYSTVKKNMEHIHFDCREMGSQLANYRNFFGDTKVRWCIRHATGKELASDGKAPVDEALKGVEETYRYYHHVYPLLNLEAGPEITSNPYSDVLDEPVPGCVIGTDGRFHTSADNPVALVVYVGKKGSVEKGTDYRGLAIALRNAGGSRLASSQWMKGNDYKSCTEIEDPIFKTQLVNCLNGLQMTKKLAADGHDHPAAKQCLAFTPKLEGAFSDWFLPSAGQWILMAEGLFGAKWEYGEFTIPGYDTQYNSANILNEILQKAGVYYHEIPTEWMWSVTEASANNVWIISFGDDEPIEIDDHSDKATYYPVVPMIAF